MKIRKKNEFVPYELTRPGFEAVYTGDNMLPPESKRDSFQKYGQDENGNVFTEFSCWGFANMDEEKWTDEVKYINSMQTGLGELDDSTREIRAQISSLQCCDSGIPVTIDEILCAIGTGVLPDHAFHPGCWLSLSSRTTQPKQQESMVIIEKVIREYLEGRSEAELLEENKYASGFIARTFDWLGPVDKLSELQKLMLERFFFPSTTLPAEQMTMNRLTVCAMRSVAGERPLKHKYQQSQNCRRSMQTTNPSIMSV